MFANTKFLGGPIGKAFLAISVVSLALFIAVEDLVLIHFLNIVSMAVAGGAAAAYFPVARDAYFKREPTMADVYAFGSFCIWMGLFLSRVVSISIRTHWGNWLRDSDAVSVFLILVLIGGVCHLNAHKIEAGALPPAQWRRFGVIIAFAILIATMMWQYKSFINIS